MNEKESNAGISFNRLIPFLTPKFRKELADGSIDKIKEVFVLNTESAYETLHAVIKYSVEKDNKNIKKKKSFLWS